jgi:hypothetical protein
VLWLGELIRIEKIGSFPARAKNSYKFLAYNHFSLGICPKIRIHRHCMPEIKKRVIKSLDNLPEDLRELLRKQYPSGYEGNITRITNAKKEPIFVFPLETDDSIILVKVPATKNSDGEYDVESHPEEEFETSDSEDFGTEEFGGDDDYDSTSDKPSREASYDPDFDG